jgi:NAD(P)-dependent dehydrogenase (short-subunit alcohol dehydrogenase family)
MGNPGRPGAVGRPGAAGAPVALVTGAGRGIGRGVAGELASRGWRVFGGVRREPAEPLPDGVELVHLDVTDPDPTVIPRHLDALVNNAGVDPANVPLECTTAAEWRRVLDTNVVGVAEVTRLALPSLRRGSDAVLVNVTSAGLAVPMPFFGLYRASKAAVSALSESLATELAPLGIRVVEVMPGPVDTDMLAASGTHPGDIEADGYGELAELVAALRPATDERAVGVAVAASAIADSIEEARAAPPGGVPLRQFCDEVGSEVVGAWQATPDEQHIAAFRSVFTPG